MNKDAMYHACRLAYVACEDGIPWHKDKYKKN